MRFALLAIVGLAACDPGTEEAGGDAGELPQGADASASCAIPSATPSWLEAAQDSDLRRLTGIEPTPGGVTLSERSTPGNRNATRAFLQSRFSELGYAPLFDDYGSGINVYAELGATLPTEDTIVIGAHFDSVPGSPGANDNATGVAMVLAAARYAREIECRNQNVLFALFDEEEIGLIGSDNFAQLISRAEFGANITAVHTVDQMGWDEDGDRAFELERPDANLMNLYLDARATLGAEMQIHQTSTGSTDHVSFRPYGFDAVGLTEEYVNGDTTPHYHLSSDSYQTVDRAFLASTTTLLLQMLGEGLVPASAAAEIGTHAPRLRLEQRYRAALARPRRATPTRAHGCRH